MQMMISVLVSHTTDSEASNWREELCNLACASVEDEPSDVEISSEDDERRVQLVHTRRPFT